MLDLTKQIVALLPSGQAWPKYIGSNLYKTVNLFTSAVQRVIDFANYANDDTFPPSAVDSVDVWRSSVGLPDVLCPQLTPAQQRLQMIERVEVIGNQSPQFFVDVAAKIGYEISITELAVPRAGLSKAQVSASNGDGADHIWVINVADTMLSPFRAGRNRAGDPLNLASDISWLRYEFNRISPSHTIVEWNVG